MRVYIRRTNGDCWSGQEWINLSCAAGARDACDFETYEAATGYLEDALTNDPEGNFSEASVVTVTPRDEIG